MDERYTQDVPEEVGQFSRRKGGTFKGDANVAQDSQYDPQEYQRTSYLKHGGSPQKLKKKSHKGLVIAIIVVVVLAAAGFGAWRYFGGGHSHVEAGQQVTIQIEEGSSATRIADQLAEAGVVDSARGFKNYVVSQGLDASLLPGEYIMYTGMTYEDAATQLVNGTGTTDIVLTIPEGCTIEQTAQRVEDATGIPAEEFLTLCRSASEYQADYPFLSEVYGNSLEGFLFPKTYTFKAGVDADTIIRAMLDQFQFEFAVVDTSYAESRNLTPYEVVIIASCVEKETLYDDDRPHVAGVIYNRLAQGIKLGLDCTAAYAAGVSGQQLTTAELEVDSPYNTYVHYGLPAGPICSPGLSSLQAAAAPLQTEDLYFILTEDYSHFYVTYEDFLEGKKAWQEGN